ncbi:MAG TPA: cysteine desulfurase family protein [Candidatus Wallbacteria bacterium]|nr:cysteine desulfurase family protein [Candidatus Wallbacteria bacterium]
MENTRTDSLIYLDNNATTPVLEEAAAALNGALRSTYGNPSSYHRAGMAAGYVIEKARASVARLIGAAAPEIIFTSSGTEANNTAIYGTIGRIMSSGGKSGPANIVTTGVEHHSVSNAVKAVCSGGGISVKRAAISSECKLEPEEFERLIDENTVLVSVMLANNETGAIFPVSEIGGICARRGVLFHVDAVCATGKIRYSVKDINCDLLSISAHKLYGPKGAACLYKKRGVEITPLFRGGHQEANLRAGTENVPAIAGFGAACDYFFNNIESSAAHYLKLKELFSAGIKKALPGATLNCSSGEALPNTVSLTLDFCDIHEVNAFMFNIDLAGVCVSLGAACSSMAKEPSEVLTAMGMSDIRAHSTVRVSFGVQNTEDEVLRAIRIMEEAYGKITRARKLRVQA